MAVAKCYVQENFEQRTESRAKEAGKCLQVQ